MLSIKNKKKEQKKVKTIQGDYYSKVTVIKNRKLIESKLNTLKEYERKFINFDVMSDVFVEMTNSKNEYENEEMSDPINKEDVIKLNHDKCIQIMEVYYICWSSCLDEVSWITNEGRYIDLHKDLHFQLLNQLIQNRCCIKDNEYSETFTDWDLRHLNSCIKVTKGLFKMINDTRILFIGRHGKGLTPCGVKTDRTNVELYLNKINEVTRYQKDGDYYSGNWKIYKKIEDLILDSSSDRD